MLELAKCIFNIPQHGEVHRSLVVIPVEGDATEQLSHPIYGNFIDIFECPNEVLYILKGGVFYSKIVHHQAEGDVALFMSP
eukprot:1468445-Ditylum_brightwellii.AAC.1